MRDEEGETVATDWYAVLLFGIAMALERSTVVLIRLLLNKTSPSIFTRCILFSPNTLLISDAYSLLNGT
jgi:hypothetical protein